MAENLFLWQNEASFEKGQCENVSLANHTVSLEQAGGRFLQAGCYTTGEVQTAAFDRLVASWNADTPQGTVVEVQARVFTRGAWSNWYSWGKWSPFLARKGGQQQKSNDGVFSMEKDTLCIHAPGGATALQMRVFLYSDDAAATPCLHLLGAALRLHERAQNMGEAIARAVPSPAYSQHVRNPLCAHHLGSPTTVAMLLNRYGEDVLPEEVAHACFDYAAKAYDNLSFAMAAAGGRGFEAYVAYLDVAGLKKQVKNGYACGVRVRNFTAEDSLANKNTFLLVRGFETDANGTETVLCMNPDAPTDETAESRYPLQKLVENWNGIAYIVHGRRPGQCACAPSRYTASLHPAEMPGEYSLFVQGMRKALPVDYLQQNGACVGTVAYTVHDTTRCCATTAQKTFFYGQVSASGNVVLDIEEMPAGAKITMFLIGAQGNTYVAELKA